MRDLDVSPLVTFRETVPSHFTGAQRMQDPEQMCQFEVRTSFVPDDVAKLISSRATGWG